MTADLNPAQRAAVEAEGHRIVVRAGPGSGKTRVLTERARRLADAGERVTLVAFTRAAAREMSDRLEHHPRIWIGTAHGLAARILAERPEFLPAGLPKGEPWGVADPAAARLAERTAGKGCGERALHAVGLVTYDDLLAGAMEAISVGAWWAPGPVLIDEAQDLSHREWRILTRCAANHWFAVGDFAQAIFGWRGGAVAEFGRALEAADVRLELPDTYRLTPTIADTANHCPVEGRVDVQSRRTATVIVADGATVISPDHAVDLAAVMLGAGQSVTVLARTKRVLGHALRRLRDAGVPATAPVLDEAAWDTAGGRLLLAVVHFLANRHDSLHLRAVLEAGGWPAATLAKAEAERNRHATSLWVAIAASIGHDPTASDLADALLESGPLPEAASTAVRSIVLRRGGVTPDGWDTAHAILRRWNESALATQDGPAEFLAWIADPGRAPLPAGSIGTDKPAVECCTIHGAKGREWDVVILWACEEGVLPLGRDDVDVEEERRLFYVATTRARNGVRYVVEPGRPPSRFLEEVGL